MKVVINSDYGGFSVSKKVYDELGLEWDGCGFVGNEVLDIDSSNLYAYRADKRLIAAIEKIGCKKSSTNSSGLKIIDIPDGVDFDIYEYDGWESVHERHRSWD